MSVGDIVPCPLWNHAEMCNSPHCESERLRSHADCTWCGGTKRVRIAKIHHEAGMVDAIETEPAP